MFRTGLIAVLVGLALLASTTLASCDGSEDQKTNGQITFPEVEITAASGKDKQIALDLREYARRGCQGDFDFGGAPTALNPAFERAIVRRYGSVDNYRESFERGCESYRQIAVKNGVITLSTSLAPGDEGHRDAEQVCNYIQGSDVADLEAHTILDRDGRFLFLCRGTGP